MQKFKLVFLFLFILLLKSSSIYAQSNCVCGATSSNYTIGSTNTSISNWTLPTTLTNACITVNGTLNIASNVNVGNCLFVMTPNSQIVVQNSTTTFRAASCCFKGTTSFWNTINVNVGASVFFNGCQFRDATYAVTVNQLFGSGSTSNISINNSSFQKNVYGVYSPFVTGNVLGSLNISIRNCNFNGASTVSTFHQTYGIYLTNLTSLNLSSLSGINTYQDLNFGIYTETIGAVTISNSSFAANSSTFINGASIGVMCDNTGGGATFIGTLNFTGLGGSYPTTPTISNLTDGIEVWQCGVNICKSNIFTNNIGIYVQNSPSIKHYIADNRIVGLGRAIFIKGCAPFSCMSIVENNHIDVLGDSPINPGEGISIWDPTNNNSLGVMIRSNWINLMNGGFNNLMGGGSGIHGQIHSNSQILNNYINITYQSAAQYQIGIYFKNGTNNTISCNTVESNSQLGRQISTSMWTPMGCAIDGTTSCNINCNTFGSTSNPIANGLHFDHPCGNTTVRGNNFINNGFGLICGINNCTLNPSGQLNQGNQWNMTPPTPAYSKARHFGGPSQILSSIFKTNPSDGLVLSPVSGILPSSFFAFTSGTGIPVLSQCTNSCSNYMPPPKRPIPNNDNLTEATYAIARGFITNPNFPETEQWLRKKDAFQILQHNDSLRYSDTTYMNFYTSMANSSIHNFASMDFYMDSLLNYDNILDSLYMLTYQQQANLVSLDSSFSIIDSSNFENWQTQHENLLSELNNTINVTQTYIDQSLNSNQQYIDYLTELNNSLTEESIFEQNEKKVNDVILKTVAIRNYQFTETQKQDIISIALQCPLAGGNRSVYAARSIWSLFSDSLPVFNDISNCITDGYFFRNGNYAKSTINLSETKLNKIEIYPNPATDFITIEDNNQIVKAYSLYSLTGKLLINKTDIEATNSIISINTQSIDNGLYVLKLRTSDGVQKQFKIAIVK